MIVLPAIDIAGGRVVRASDASTGDPVEEARAAYAAGARWLHVVDMDRAYRRGRNDPEIRAIAAVPGGAVQLGGGLTHPDDLREAFRWGVHRVTVDLAVLLDAALLAAAVATVDPARLAGNLDLRGGKVWPRSAARPVLTDATEVVDRAVSAGIRTVICRDLDRDGALSGADLAAAARLTGRGADVIAAGGVAELEEIARGRTLGLAGIIVGRALHAGRFALAEALTWSG